jgi:hypothetical protein
MKRFISALALVAMAASTIAGCGDDDDDGGTDTGGTDTGGKGNSAGEPVTTEPGGGESGDAGGSGSVTPGAGGAPSMNLGCTPSEATTCQNETDCPFVIDGTARTEAQTCGKGCLGSTEENCARDCITMELSMTDECASCYADFVNCTIANCVGECLADPNSDECHTCQEDEGCRPDFDTCSGLPE